MMRSNPTDLLRNAADAILSPKQQEQKIKEEAAKLNAEFEARWQAEHSARPSALQSVLYLIDSLTMSPKNKQVRNRFLSKSNGAVH